MGLLPCYTQLTRHEHPLDRCPRRRDEHPSGCKLGATLTLRKSTFLATNAPLEDPGAQLVREVASKTSDTAGDGTTTATVHAQAIFREGIKMVVVGANPMELKRGIEKAVEAIVGELKKMSKPVSGNMIGQVGTISANSDDTIGTIIAQAMEKVGKDGVIAVPENRKQRVVDRETSLDVVEGMQFDRGYLSPYFVTDPDRMECVLENPVIVPCTPPESP